MDIYHTPAGPQPEPQSTPGFGPAQPTSRATPDFGVVRPAAPTQTAAVSKRVYETDRRDRALLALTLALGALVADALMTFTQGWPALELTLLVFLWEGVYIWYVGAPRTRAAWWFTGAVVLLALTFTLYTDRWLYGWNLLFLPMLMTAQMFEGISRRAWSRPTMLLERFCLLMTGLFGRLGASLQTVKGVKTAGKEGKGRGRYVLLGLVLTLPILAVVLPLLLSADPLFERVVGRLPGDAAGVLLGRLFLGTLLVPFLFGLLYSIRRPDQREGKGIEVAFSLDPAVLVTLLGVLDGLYLCFVAVQATALFGGEAYLARAGISYAEYARSGFFQLVWVSAINLAVVVSAVHFCRREGKLWQGVRLLSTALVALSGVMLVSACWRMSLYVAAYGMSFKRLLTYWGMAMLLIFFVAALLKIWRRTFGFFRVLLVAGVAGWLILNLMDPSALVARYNVDVCLKGGTVDMVYLTGLPGYGAQAQLERLPGDLAVGHTFAYWEDGKMVLREQTLDELLTIRRQQAAANVDSWQTWNLSDYLASRE